MVGSVVGGRVGGSVGAGMDATGVNPFESDIVFYAPLRNSLTAAVGTTPTFARATSGYYVDNGNVVKNASTNVPRFQSGLGLLLENTTSQYLTYTDDPSNAAWQYNANVTISQDGTLAPDGVSQAWKIAATANGAAYIAQDRGANAGNSFSFWVRAGNVTTCSYSVSSDVVVDRGSDDTVNLPSDGSWVYIEQAASSASDTALIAVNHTRSSGSSTAGDYIYVWAPQLQDAAEPTSIILDGASNTDRQDDVLTIAAGQLAAANSAFAIGMNIRKNYDTGDFQTVFKCVNETNPRTFNIGASPNPAINAQMGTVNANSPTNVFADKDIHRVLFTADASTLKVYADGSEVISQAHGGTASSTDTEVQLNHNDKAAFHVSEIVFYNKYFSSGDDAMAEYLAHR